MLLKNIEIYLKKKETKSISMAVYDIEIFQTMKNKSQFNKKELFQNAKVNIKTN